MALLVMYLTLSLLIYDSFYHIIVNHIVYLDQRYHKGKAKKKICVFPIAWSSNLGSVGRDFYFFNFFFETYKYAPSS